MGLKFKINASNFVLLVLIAIAIDSIGQVVVSSFLSHSEIFGLFGLDMIANQLFYCLKIAVPFYVIFTLVFAFFIDKRILMKRYTSNERTFFWVLISLFVVTSTLAYLYLFSLHEYTVANFEIFRSSICLK